MGYSIQESELATNQCPNRGAIAAIDAGKFHGHSPPVGGGGFTNTGHATPTQGFTQGQPVQEWLGSGVTGPLSD